MFKQLVVLLTLISPLMTFADASPKFPDEVAITLYSEHRPFSKVDSICALVYHPWGTDTATLHYSTAEYHLGATLRKENGAYIIHTRNDIESFKVILFVNGQRIESDSLQRFPGNAIFWLEKDADGKLADRSPFLHEEWYKYFTSLFVTVLVEILLGLPFYFKNRAGRSPGNYMITLIALNILTHFSLWVIYSNAYVPLFFLELAVVFAESFYWKFYFKRSVIKALLISLLINFASWIFGAILTSAV